jgi:predicted RNA-binding Zn-ribbon protein involved in translation (DUF1610 family)
MPNQEPPNEQEDSPEALCPRCGAEVSWRFVDIAKQTVQITCPDCREFEILRSEFETAEFDIAQPEERRE